MVGKFFIFFKLIYFALFFSAQCGGYIPLFLTANSICKSFLKYMSDACETANSSFTGITHISEKISICF